MSEFTQGVCDDGAAILRDGKQLTIEEILIGLNRAEALAKNARKKLNAFKNINNMCWKAKVRGEKEITVNEILHVLEPYCDE